MGFAYLISLLMNAISWSSECFAITRDPAKCSRASPGSAIFQRTKSALLIGSCIRSPAEKGAGVGRWISRSELHNPATASSVMGERFLLRRFNLLSILRSHLRRLLRVFVISGEYQFA